MIDRYDLLFEKLIVNKNKPWDQQKLMNQWNRVWFQIGIDVITALCDTIPIILRTSFAFEIKYFEVECYNVCICRKNKVLQYMCFI
jgi:hypothetical protein